LLLQAVPVSAAGRRLIFSNSASTSAKVNINKPNNIKKTDLLIKIKNNKIINTSSIHNELNELFSFSTKHSPNDDFQLSKNPIKRGHI